VQRIKDPAAREVSFFASRDISAGEELLYDYGGKFWKGRSREELP
jgi:SET domain-containing protein